MQTNVLYMRNYAKLRFIIHNADKIMLLYAWQPHSYNVIESASDINSVNLEYKCHLTKKKTLFRLLEFMFKVSSSGFKHSLNFVQELSTA